MASALGPVKTKEKLNLTNLKMCWYTFIYINKFILIICIVYTYIYINIKGETSSTLALLFFLVPLPFLSCFFLRCLFKQKENKYVIKRFKCSNCVSSFSSDRKSEKGQWQPASSCKNPERRGKNCFITSFLFISPLLFRSFLSGIPRTSRFNWSSKDVCPDNVNSDWMPAGWLETMEWVSSFISVRIHSTLWLTLSFFFLFMLFQLFSIPLSRFRFNLWLRLAGEAAHLHQLQLQLEHVPWHRSSFEWGDSNESLEWVWFN